jgi:hypothetical protein
MPMAVLTRLSTSTRLGRLETEKKILDSQGLWTSGIFSPNPITQSNPFGRGTPLGVPSDREQSRQSGRSQPDQVNPMCD